MSVAETFVSVDEEREEPKEEPATTAENGYVGRRFMNSVSIQSSKMKETTRRPSSVVALAIVWRRNNAKQTKKSARTQTTQHGKGT
jgi:hypothetical protein